MHHVWEGVEGEEQRDQTMVDKLVIGVFEVALVVLCPRHDTLVFGAFAAALVVRCPRHPKMNHEPFFSFYYNFIALKFISLSLFFLTLSFFLFLFFFHCILFQNNYILITLEHNC